MREILFRAYDQELGLSEPFSLNYYPIWNGDTKPYWANLCKIEQFTGLTDKNGQKIFEGDICSYLTPEYKDNGVHYEPKRENGKVEITNGGIFFGGWQYATPFGGCISSIEVIGNIHDNQEMLQ